MSANRFYHWFSLMTFVFEQQVIEETHSNVYFYRDECVSPLHIWYYMMVIE